MFGIKLKILKRSGTLYDLNGFHSPPASNQSLNGVLDTDPHLGHSGSILKGSHVWYQIEGLEEIWNIVRLKLIPFSSSLQPAVTWDQKGSALNTAIFHIKSKILINFKRNMTLSYDVNVIQWITSCHKKSYDHI